MDITIDPDVPADVAVTILETFAGIASRDAARPDLDGLRDAYEAAERAASIYPSEANVAAWIAAENAYRTTKR